jgi:hypothetical protein
MAVNIHAYASHIRSARRHGRTGAGQCHINVCRITGSPPDEVAFRPTTCRLTSRCSGTGGTVECGRARSSIPHQGNSACMGACISGVLRLPAANPHHTLVDDEGSKRDEAQKREGDVNEGGSALVESSCTCSRCEHWFVHPLCLLLRLAMVVSSPVDELVAPKSKSRATFAPSDAKRPLDLSIRT